MTKKYIQDFKSKLATGGTVTPEELQDFFSRLEGDLKDKKYGLVWESQTEQVIEQLKINKVYLHEDESLKITQDPDNPKSNILIEGDNYEALTYLNEINQKVDVIYIDPPYNTGNKDFIYNDRFIDKEDGFRHSQWLSFMNDRLRLARELLTDDGVIFISIDDNELYQLKLLCDQIFGEENLIANFVVKTGNQTADINKKKVHEYLLSYGKKIRGMEGNKKLMEGKEVLQEGRCTTGNLNQTMPELKFSRGIEVEGVEDGEYESPRGTGGKEDIELISGNIIVKDGKLEEDIILKARWSNGNDIRQYMEKHETGGDYPIYNKFGKELVRLYMKGDRFQPQLVKKGNEDVPTVLEGVNGKGTLDLANMGMGDTFSYPKAVKFIKYIIGTYYDKNATVLDFFAGSGTTGHAVLELNQEDGGNRQFILVTNNENNIARDVTYERNKRVIEGYTTPKNKDVPGIPANLAYYKTKQVSKYGIDFDEVMLQHIIPTIQLTEDVYSRTQHSPHTTQLGDSIFIFTQYMVEDDEIDTLVGLVKDGDILYIQEGQVDYIKSKLPEGVVYKYLEDVLPTNR